MNYPSGSGPADHPAEPPTGQPAPRGRKSHPGAPPRVAVLSAAILGIGLVVTAAALGLARGGAGEGSAAEPAVLEDVPTPEADEAACTDLLAELPETLPSAGETLPRRELAEPAPAATLAWGPDPPVSLRCGVAPPAELAPDSPLRAINGVEWLPVEGEGEQTWYALDREVIVSLRVPNTEGTGPLQLISELVEDTLEPQPVEVD